MTFDTYDRTFKFAHGGEEREHVVSLLFRQKPISLPPAFEPADLFVVVERFAERLDDEMPTDGIADFVSIAYPRASLRQARAIAKWQTLARWLNAAGENVPALDVSSVMTRVIRTLFNKRRPSGTGRGVDVVDVVFELGEELRELTSPEFFAAFREHMTGWLLSFALYANWTTETGVRDDDSLDLEARQRVLELCSGVYTNIALLSLTDGVDADALLEVLGADHTRRIHRCVVRQILWANELARCCVYGLHDGRELGFVATTVRRNRISLSDAVETTATMLTASSKTFVDDAAFMIAQSADFRVARFVESLSNLVVASQTIALGREKYASANRMNRRLRIR